MPSAQGASLSATGILPFGSQLQFLGHGVLGVAVGIEVLGAATVSEVAAFAATHGFKVLRYAMTFCRSLALGTLIGILVP